MRTVIAIGLFVLAALVGEIIAGILGELLRPLRRLYRPPHGLLVVGAGWIAGIASFVAAFGVAEYSAELAALMALVVPGIALVGTGIYRDQRRAYLGHPPAWADPPKFGVVGRLLAATATAVFGVVGIMSAAFALGEGPTRMAIHFWSAAAGGALFAYWFGFAAIRGRYPRSAGYTQ